MDQTGTIPAPSCPVDTSRAMAYIQEVQSRFIADRADVFQKFLTIFTAYMKDAQASGSASADPMHVHDVYVKVEEIFKEDPDLFSAFKKFLPDFGANGDGVAVGGAAAAGATKVEKQ